MAEGSRKESNSWLEPRVGRVESESKVPEGSEAGSRVHGASPPQLASRPPDEDVVAGRVDHPVVPLPRVVVVPWHLDEAFVEAEVVSDGVLPTLLVVLVIRELHCDVLVDAI